MHPTAVLVAEHMGHAHRELTLEDVQVAAAHPGGRDTHHDIERAVRLRLCPVLRAERLEREAVRLAGHYHGPHRAEARAPCREVKGRHVHDWSAEARRR